MVVVPRGARFQVEQGAAILPRPTRAEGTTAEGATPAAGATTAGADTPAVDGATTAGVDTTGEAAAIMPVASTLAEVTITADASGLVRITVMGLASPSAGATIQV